MQKMFLEKEIMTKRWLRTLILSSSEMQTQVKVDFFLLSFCLLHKLFD